MKANLDEMNLEQLESYLQYCNENGEDAGPVMAKMARLRHEKGLYARLEELEAKKAEHAGNVNKLEAIAMEEARIRAEIDNIKAKMQEQAKFEQLQAVQHEERVKESVEQLSNSLDNVEIHGLPFRSLFIDEERYQLAEIWFKRQVEEQAKGFSKQIQEEQLENRVLREEVNARDIIIQEMKDDIHQLTLERDQAIQYRDNAYAQLEEARKEVERLNSQVDELRVEAAVGARNAFKVVTNLDGGKELAEKIRATLIPVTNIEQINGTTIQLTHPDGTITEDSWLCKGKYRLINEEEAARFREELAEKAGEEAGSVNPPLVNIDVPTFQVRENDTEPVPSLQQETDAGDHGDGREDAENEGVEPVTRAEFEELAARVNRLEKVANLPEAV